MPITAFSEPIIQALGLGSRIYLEFQPIGAVVLIQELPVTCECYIIGALLYALL